MRRISRTALTAVWLCGAAAAGCATTPPTVFQTTWKDPQAAPVVLTGQKVVALVMSTDEPKRRRAEDALAGEMTARGARGVAAWTLLSTADAPDEQKARAALAAAGAVGVVTMQVVGRQDLDDQRVDVGSAGYRSFWGNYRWSSRVTFSPGRSHGPQVWVETLVHSLDPDALLWSGRSRTADPGETAALFGEVGRAAAAEMASSGLLARAQP